MIELIPKGSIVEQVCAFLRARSVEAYLVGGCVRDWLLGRSSHDIDFAVAGDAVKLARQVADRMRGAFVLLDEERCTGRVVTRGEDGQRLFIDFARLQGDDIITDLSRRDFTVNAIAVAVADVESLSHVIDPYDGRRDVQLGLVRAVSETAFRDDPLRTLRAVRIAAEMEASIEQGTEELLRRAVRLIANVSAERVRDELARILALPGAAQNLRYLDELGLLTTVIPELETLKGVEQSEPHYLDVFEHSLETVGRLEGVIHALKGYEGEGELSLVPLLLSPFSRRLSAHLSQPISGDRTRLTVLKLAALLHDLGKPATRSVDDEGGIHFYGHEGEGAEVVGAILRRLRFGGSEVALAKTIVANHMRPCLLAGQEVVTRRAVYRFFRDTGDTGVDTLLLYLADHLATWGPNLRMARWRRRVESVASMLADYYERHQKVISPPKLISGHDLMEEFGLEGGPRIGELLEAVREAQAEGEVRTQEDALALVEGLLAGVQAPAC
jgi:putative nucleotidyltransferase with HDIG domain